MSRDNYKIVRSVKKNLPYTISNPYGLELRDQFRAENALKETAWQMRKEARHQGIVRAMEDGSLLPKEFKKSSTTKAYERQAKERAEVEMYCAKPSYSAVVQLDIPKPSIITQVKTWLTDWFTSIKF
jgi:hypothetical protein